MCFPGGKQMAGELVELELRGSGQVALAPAPTTEIEAALCEIFAGVAGVGQIEADDHFFEQLNADSLMMAQFCARVRKHPDLPAVGMKDIYRYPSVRSLAAALTETSPSTLELAPVADVAVPAAAPAVSAATTLSSREHVVCGTLQLLCFLGYVYLGALAFSAGYGWISAGSGVVALYLRSVVVGGLFFVGLCTLPIALKWLLIGRWRPQQIRIWSLGYVRFWLVRVLVRANPLVLMAGSPVYVLYLRALGAKIGPGVAIFSVDVPVCTDLLRIGAGTVIRKDSHFSCYRARAGMIETGTVTIGKHALVSESTVLDIDTSLGDHAQLGHASALHATQSVPDGQRWHGSPAQPTDTDFAGVEPVPCSLARRFLFGLGQLVTVVVFSMPLAIGGAAMLLAEAPRVARFLSSWTSEGLVVQVLAASLTVFLGSVLIGVVAAFLLPRLLAVVMVPDKVYPLYGFHYSLHRTVTRLTNLKFFNELFGNSSYVVPYLRRLGYDVSKAEQTGSNFGTEFKHETPYLVSIGRGTMIADGLSLMNAEYSSTSFKLARTSLGAHSFLGNHIAYPARGRTGENVLLATKVMVPIDGKVREGVGLLGSPSFEIPRSVERDSRFDHLKTPENLRTRLAAKNRHNLATLAIFLLSRWVDVLGLTAIFVLTDFSFRFGSLALVAEILLALLFTFAYFILLERAAAGFRRLRPQYCSIYDPYFWWHERFWKFAIGDRLAKLVGGTPFKTWVSRLLGARVGKRVFDDDCAMPERSLVTIGDDCTLGAGAAIQCHSQEDGAFKADRIVIGDGCTLGAGALVHYSSTLGDGVVVAPDAFVMKGTEAVAGTVWTGNPAREAEPAWALTVGGRG